MATVRKRHFVFSSILLSLGMAAALLVGASRGDSDDGLLDTAKKSFEALPKDPKAEGNPAQADLVELGRKLFFDPRISIDGTGSCVRCHQPALYGTDGLAGSIALHDKVLPRNAPTVLNSGLQFRIHWDGVFASVEEQAGKALLGPGFLNADNSVVVARVKAIPGYPELFRKAFPKESDPVTVERFASAIGAFERTLNTRSRFDDYLDGKGDSLTAIERKGLRRFIETGCSDCHDGVGLGGSAYQKFGVFDDYWKATGSADADKGRFNVTKDDNDLYTFKVPSLRNVAMTAPFFHDGSVNDLQKAVKVMASVQLGKTLADQEVTEIVAFLGSLTGPLPAHFANAPILPAGGFRPKP